MWVSGRAGLPHPIIPGQRTPGRTDPDPVLDERTRRGRRLPIPVKAEPGPDSSHGSYLPVLAERTKLDDGAAIVVSSSSAG